MAQIEGEGSIVRSTENGRAEGSAGRPVVRVLLADDHVMFREGLAGLLASRDEGMEVVGQTDNDEGAVALAREEKPDVVVMRARAPMERARESLLEMRRIEPPPKVVICTMLEDPGHMRELLGMGASAYLFKSASAEQLVRAIRAAVFDPEGGNKVVVEMPRAMPEETQGGGPGGILSARELEILLLVSRGLSNRQVASTLRLAEATVKRHLANAYPKMGVASRGEAVRKALHEGWITVEEVTEGSAEG